MCEVTIRGDRGDFLRIVILGRSYVGATDYWDGNWVRVAFELKTGGFSGSISGDLRAEELVSFLEQFKSVQQSLHGTAEFETMEGWLSIRARGNGRGHIEFRCKICDEPGIGNTLDCTLRTDQTFTRTALADLEAAVKEFPVIGSRAWS